MRMPEDGPFGETLFEASERTMVAALLVNNPLGGCVESVVTVLTQRFFFPEDRFPDGTSLDCTDLAGVGGSPTRSRTIVISDA